MDRQSVEQQVRGIVADILNVPVEDLPTGSAASREEWESVQNLNIILAVEQAMGMAFEPEEMERMRSIEQIVDTVMSRQSKA